MNDFELLLLIILGMQGGSSGDLYARDYRRLVQCEQIRRGEGSQSPQTQNHCDQKKRSTSSGRRKSE